MWCPFPYHVTHGYFWGRHAPLKILCHALIKAARFFFSFLRILQDIFFHQKHMLDIFGGICTTPPSKIKWSTPYPKVVWERRIGECRYENTLGFAADNIGHVNKLTYLLTYLDNMVLRFAIFSVKEVEKIKVLWRNPCFAWLLQPQEKSTLSQTKKNQAQCFLPKITRAALRALKITQMETEIFSSPGSKRCPVQTIKSYLSHLNPEVEFLFQRPPDRIYKV